METWRVCLRCMGSGICNWSSRGLMVKKGVFRPVLLWLLLIFGRSFLWQEGSLSADSTRILFILFEVSRDWGGCQERGMPGLASDGGLLGYEIENPGWIFRENVIGLVILANQFLANLDFQCTPVAGPSDGKTPPFLKCFKNKFTISGSNCVPAFFSISSSTR